MPECHKCPHNKKSSLACLTCQGPDECHALGHSSSRAARGRVVSLDALAEHSRGDLDHNGVAAQMSPLGSSAGESPQFYCSEEQELAVRQALQALSSMDDNLVLLFLGLCRGESFSKTAARLRISRNSLYLSIRKLRRIAPELASILGTAERAGKERNTSIASQAEKPFA